MASAPETHPVTDPSVLSSRCELLRSLHVPGDPLVLANAWDAATARKVVEAGSPVVATTSGGVAAALGYEDHEGAPAGEMLAAAGRIAGAVDVPVTVDAEAGYGMEPAQLVSALRAAGAAGCNLEDTNHADGTLRDPASHAAWLRGVRQAAAEVGYPFVINARVDVFLADFLAQVDRAPAAVVMSDGLERAHAYFEAGVDCVYPIGLWERDALASFVTQAGGPVNALASPRSPGAVELAGLGVARISHATFLYRAAMDRFGEAVAQILAATPPAR
jgi:2-methylisocitrate lyase-like PEP mutase family enzyme